jgi:predicted Zn finger-like uncharacterized protein
MKVVCESCQAKYQVPDERVAGKKLKIRCKRCGATVLIRGDLAGSEAQGGIVSAAPSEPAPYAVSGETPVMEWHVSVDGDTRGPYSTEELKAWLDSSPSAWDAHVWREGFSDWLEARACAELGPAPAYGAPDHAHEDEGPTQTFESASLSAAPFMAQAAAARRAAREGARTTSSIRTRGAPSGFSFAPAPRVSGASTLGGERSDDSVLFSSQNLQSMTSSAPVYTPGPNPGFAGGEGSGLIDIRALASLARQTQPRIANPAAAVSDSAPAPDAGLSYGTDEEDPRAALMNQPSAFGRVDSLAPISNTQQTSNVAVPLAILGGCALVAAAVFAAILIARPSRPPRDDAMAMTLPPAVAPESDEIEPPPAAATAQPMAEPQEPSQPAPTEAAPGAAPSPTASSDEGLDEDALAAKSRRSQRLPRTAADEKKTGAPEEKAKPKKEEKSSPPSSDEVMLADKAKPKPAAPAPAPTPPAEASKPEPPPAAKSGSSASDIDSLLAAKPPAKPSGKSSSIDDLMNGAATDKAAAAPASKPAPAPAPAASSAPAAATGLPEQPSRDETLAAMRGVESAVRACASGQTITGKADVALTVTGSTGRVTTANVTGITGAVGSCIARAVRLAKFPKFSRPTFSISYPYKF